MIAGGAGALIAGGRSRRFGGDKRRAEWNGAPLAKAALQALTGVFPLVLVAVKDAADGVFLAGPGVRIVADDSPGLHPLAGVVAALEASPAPRLFAAAADMPLLRPALVRRLWEMEGEVVIPLWRDVPQPLCAVYSRSAIPSLRRLIDGNAPARAAADLPGARLVQPSEWREADPEGLSFLDVDTPEDLRALTPLSTENLRLTSSGVLVK